LAVVVLILMGFHVANSVVSPGEVQHARAKLAAESDR
jgi:hypothetical protein